MLCAFKKSPLTACAVVDCGALCISPMCWTFARLAWRPHAGTDSQLFFNGKAFLLA